MPESLKSLDREAEAAVRDIRLPPCPAVLAQLVREIRADEPDLARLTKLIGGDVTLAAAVLRSVNSAFYGLRTRVVSIKHALALLGLNTVASLVTGLLLRQAFPAGASAHMEEFWERSAGNARAAHRLARSVEGVDPEAAYTFALFRDCGIPAMLCGCPGYDPRDAAPSTGQSVTAAESERYGTDHALIGSRLAGSWLLPDTLSQAVLWHHDYPALAAGTGELARESTHLIALAFVAEELYSRHTAGESAPEWGEHGRWALAQLGLADSDLEELAPQIAAAIDGK